MMQGGVYYRFNVLFNVLWESVFLKVSYCNGTFLGQIGIHFAPDENTAHAVNCNQTFEVYAMLFKMLFIAYFQRIQLVIEQCIGQDNK